MNTRLGYDRGNGLPTRAWSFQDNRSRKIYAPTGQDPQAAAFWERQYDAGLLHHSQSLVQA